LGTILGTFADLADATGLARPILNVVDPVPQVHVAGSNTVLGEELGLMADWQEAFQAEHGRERRVPLIGRVWRPVEISVFGEGSLAGEDQALGGQVDLLVESTPLTDTRELEERGITVECAAVIGYDVIAFVTDMNNPMKRSILLDNMSAILAGEITTWSSRHLPVDGNDTPIRILARQGSGTTAVVLRNFEIGGTYRPYFIPCDNNESCLNRVLNTPGALYWASTAWLHTQPPGYYELVLVEGTSGVPPDNPILEGFHPRDSEYPPQLIRPLYMYVLSDGSDAESTEYAEAFLRYVLSTRGQEILEAHHLYTHFARLEQELEQAQGQRFPGLDVRLPPGFGRDEPDDPPIICRSDR
jgi:ABC-type phosphate transport system substrate-binding protein